MPKPPPEPTKFELEILHVVWKSEPATVRDVEDVLGRERPLSRTGLATTMQRMREKGLLKLVDARKPQKYTATRSREDTYEQSLKGLNQRFLRRSIADVVRGLLGSAKPTRAEVDEVKRILDEHKAGGDVR